MTLSTAPAEAVLTVFERLRENSLAWPAAEALVRRDVHDGLGPEHANLLGDAAFRRATRAPDDAWLLARLCWVVVDEWWPDSGTDVDAVRAGACTAVCADVVAVAHTVLLGRGDLRVFALAEEAGRLGEVAAVRAGDADLLAALLQRRGSLLFDCYSRGGTSGHAGAFELWTAAAGDDPDLVLLASRRWTPDGSGEAALRWPPREEVLGRARDDLRRAFATTSESRRRAASGVVLVQVLDLLAQLSGRPDPEVSAEIVEVARTALDLLPPDDVVEIATVRGVLARHDPGHRGGPVLVPELLETDFAAYLRETGDVPAWHALSRLASDLGGTDPGRALEVLRLQRRTLAWRQPEFRADHHSSVHHLLARALGTPGVHDRLTADFSAASTSVFETPTVDGDLIAVALQSAQDDRQPWGLHALDVLEERHPDLWSVAEDSLVCLRVFLLHSRAVDEHSAGAASAAFAWAWEALERALDPAADWFVPRVLDLLSDVLAGDPASCTAEHSAGWMERAAEVWAHSPDPAPVARLARRILAARSEQGMSPEELWLLLQTVRPHHGDLGSALPALSTPATSRLLRRERERRAAVGDPLLAPAPWWNALDEDTLVTAYADRWEVWPEESPVDEVVGLRRAVESVALRPPEAGSADGSGRLLRMPDDVRATCGDDTAVLHVFVGEREGAVTVFTALVTPWSVDGTASGLALPYPATPVSLQADGRSVHVPPEGLLVAAARQAVQEEPAPQAVSAAAADRLTSLAGAVLPDVTRLHASGRLAELRELVVVPHGALHYLPFHLLPVDGEPLGARTLVTYAHRISEPLTRDRTGRPPDRQGASVFALSYRDGPLPSVVTSSTEAHAVATAWGTTPTLDEDATGREFLRSLETSTTVHVRAHGRQDVDAPLFHSLYLSPDDEHDGVVFAHEVLRRDLRGLELVSLSACETALGRVDPYDAHRGLPAALLAAGAGAVVGTAWAVEQNASTTFFTGLHRSFVRDRDVSSAFATAQRETRHLHPEYRDWGAFFLVRDHLPGRRANT